MCARPASPLPLTRLYRRPGGRAKRGNPGPMHTIRWICSPVFIGSGFAAARRPGMTSCSARERSPPELAPALRERSQPQSLKADEALRVLLVEGDRAVLERDELLIVERIGALAADHGRLALVEFQPHPARDELLAAVDRGLQHLALRREPEAVVDELGVARHQLVFEVRGAAVECDLLDAAVRGEQDRAARRLVHAARFHSDETIFD